ncbi:5-formyltetrahydrofolate cyclo-ligase [Sphingosinicella sp. YJ22]|uniref:5-formyltetrahydrofolate cyclo-ligase n=1 Tax=Sphingosinicella sp. YJ22 TaxID=1104780 RepID=UPI00140C8C76|nr:5-formyltetrahydrofolate cyclo-ligase [Sphingosinicella sp. YJ22]
MAVPSPSPKDALRAAALQARRAFARSLAADTRAELEAQLAERVLTHVLTARVIAGYHPLRDEISPYPILDRLIDGQRAVLPSFADRDARMIWREAPATEPSPWGILQPPLAHEALAPDLVLVPLVMADRRGTRIGHGKGHYDRALAHLRDGGHEVYTIGLGWDVQVSDTPLPADPWDQRLDAIATPREWIACRT